MNRCTKALVALLCFACFITSPRMNGWVESWNVDDVVLVLSLSLSLLMCWCAPDRRSSQRWRMQGLR